MHPSYILTNISELKVAIWKTWTWVCESFLNTDSDASLRTSSQVFNMSLSSEENFNSIKQDQMSQQHLSSMFTTLYFSFKFQTFPIFKS